MKPGVDLPQVRLWTDAAGESRMIAAVMEIAGKWYYTYMKVPDDVWDQFLQRNDHQIGVQEMLAVVLAVYTFHSWLLESRITNFIDNNGVLMSIIKGSARCPEVAAMIARLWAWMAMAASAYVVGRVESKANIADGPTRDRFVLLQRLQAQYVSPILPQWASDLWSLH